VIYLINKKKNNNKKKRNKKTLSKKNKIKIKKPQAMQALKSLRQKKMTFQNPQFLQKLVNHHLRSLKMR